MGIEGLLAYIRKNHPYAHLKLPITFFKGKRMAVDVSGFMYRNMSIARSEAIKKMDLEKGYDEALVRKFWYSKLISVFINLLENGVLPIVVFDGQGPQLKSGEREKRNQKFKEKQEEIRVAKEALEAADIFDKKEMVENLRKAYKNDTSIPPADHDLIRIVLKGSGLPCLQSSTEADHLCASLCCYGEVAAVFSADSDILTHGSPMLVTNFMTQKDMKKEGITERTVVCYHLGYLLESMKMSMSTFVDFCIMCGCDYNDKTKCRIPGIGPSKAEKLLKKYLYIEDIPKKVLRKTTKKKNKDVSIDKYLRHLCREQFSHFPLDELIVEFEEKDDYDSDEELPEDYNDKNEKTTIFGNRKDKFQLVSDADIRTVFDMVNIGDLSGKMKSSIWKFLEDNDDDSGEPGHLYFTWVPKKHIWKPDGDLYIDGKFFESFKEDN